jgi:hypothetical protein
MAWINKEKQKGKEKQKNHHKRLQMKCIEGGICEVQ